MNPGITTFAGHCFLETTGNLSSWLFLTEAVDAGESGHEDECLPLLGGRRVGEQAGCWEAALC